MLQQSIWPCLAVVVALGSGTAHADVVESPASGLLPPASIGLEPTGIAPAPAAATPAGRVAPGQAAATPGVSFQRVGEALMIAVRLAGASAAKLTRSGTELLLSFPRALPQFDGQALLDQAKGVLDGLSVGYDTLLLQLGPGIGFVREDAPDTLRLTMRPDAGEAPVAATPSNDQGALRLRLLDAQLLAQEGQTAAARAKMQALLPDMRDSPEPLAGLAGLDQSLGRWRLARSEYAEALRFDPGNPSIGDAVAAIDRAQASRVRVDIESRQTEGGLGAGRATALIEGLSGHHLFGDGWRVGFASDLAHVNAQQVQRANGVVSTFRGTRGRTEVYLQHDGLDGNVFTGSLFSNGDTVGGGLRAELPDEFGMTSVRAEYRRPDWDFFQSIVDQGTRDRLSIARRQQFGSDLSARLEVALNRYNIEHAPDVARTVSVNGELRLGRLAGVRGLSVAYVLDGEYLFKQAERTGPGGTRYKPLQLVDREVHALTLGYAGVLGHSAANGLFTYELSGGYGVDRYGKFGPLAGAVLAYSVGQFEVRARASFVQNIGRSRGMTSIFGTSLTWLF